MEEGDGLVSEISDVNCIDGPGLQLEGENGKAEASQNANGKQSLWKTRSKSYAKQTPINQDSILLGRYYMGLNIWTK